MNWTNNFRGNFSSSPNKLSYLIGLIDVQCDVEGVHEWFVGNVHFRTCKAPDQRTSLHCLLMLKKNLQGGIDAERRTIENALEWRALVTNRPNSMPSNRNCQHFNITSNPSTWWRTDHCHNKPKKRRKKEEKIKQTRNVRNNLSITVYFRQRGSLKKLPVNEVRNST